MEISIVQKLNLKFYIGGNLTASVPRKEMFVSESPSAIQPVQSFYLGRISYCSADATFTHVFAFIAVNRADCLQCYAFLARKQKIVSQPVEDQDIYFSFSFSILRFI